eukprot:3291866-Pyramimonas_sp.AAC.1
MVSGSTLGAVAIRSNSFAAYCSLPSVAHALISVLYVMVSGSTPVSTIRSYAATACFHCPPAGPDKRSV